MRNERLLFQMRFTLKLVSIVPEEADNCNLDRRTILQIGILEIIIGRMMPEGHWEMDLSKIIAWCLSKIWLSTLPITISYLCRWLKNNPIYSLRPSTSSRTLSAVTLSPKIGKFAIVSNTTVQYVSDTLIIY